MTQPTQTAAPAPSGERMIELSKLHFPEAGEEPVTSVRWRKNGKDGQQGFRSTWPRDSFIAGLQADGWVPTAAEQEMLAHVGCWRGPDDYLEIVVGGRRMRAAMDGDYRKWEPVA